jgi:L-threonylcarbamoyladenylate synthase
VSAPIVSHLDPDSVRRAAEILGNGGIVALPTETVYGLGASIDSASGVNRIFTVKGRPTDHPLIVHGSSASILDEVSDNPSEFARRLAAEVWPGPLSLLVPRSQRVSPSVTGGRDTVVVRVPAHDFFRTVVDHLGSPIAAPSANRFGRVSPTTADHVAADLGNDVDLIVDGGPSVIGVESTIEDVEALLGISVAESDGTVRAPGTLASHYAPRCQVVLAETAEEAKSRLERLPSSAGIVETPPSTGVYAATLYTTLRTCDERGWTHAVFVLPQDRGLGRAIRDRLKRAAATIEG